jgi:hypothetical protein
MKMRLACGDKLCRMHGIFLHPTPIKGMINFVNLSKLIGNDETAGNPA